MSTDTEIFSYWAPTVGEMVMEFHEAYAVPVGNSPATLEPDREALRLELIAEEYQELKDAVGDKDFVEQVDALADMVYVIYGMAIEMGVDLDSVIKEVHRSNMSKLDDDGNPIYRDDGKVLKSSLYQPPDIKGVLGLQ